MKRVILIMLVTLICGVSAQAVLKEKNLPATLSVLRAELETAYSEQQASMSRYRQTTEAQHRRMVAMMQKSDQISLMLYSQRQDFTFDLTYACHEATDLYREFNKKRMPYDRIIDHINTEIKRYDALIASLKAIPPAIGRAKPSPTDGRPMPPAASKGAGPTTQPFVLDKQGQADRTACLSYATSLRRNLITQRERIRQDSEHYKQTAQKLKTLNDYALGRYSAIQHSIFINGDDNYFEVLSAFSNYLGNAKADYKEKYETEKTKGSDGHTRPVPSQWRGPIVMGLTVFVLFYVVLAALLGNAIIRWVVPKRFRTAGFMKKKVCLILSAAMIVFALSLMVARMFMSHNFFLMASRLLIEYSWLLCAIFASLLIRLPGDQIKSGFRIYTPVMLMSFIVISFRIIFIPNNIVQLVFPPVLLVFTFWQWNVIKRHNTNIPKTDIFYTWVSLTLMVASTVVAWNGYTLLSVQMLIWWMFQLTCIQTITCIYDLLGVYERKVLSRRIGISAEEIAVRDRSGVLDLIQARHEGHINKTWFYDFVSMALVPVLGVFSVLLSIWWAADVFDLTETVSHFFMVNFLNITGVVQLSLAKIVLVASQFFVFRYMNYLIKALYHKYHKSKVVVNGRPNFTLANNVIAICVWGLYFIISIRMLKIPSTAISVISAGLATGVGFAMKDLLENFFYGISLMTGRVRVGDFIECDGIRGKVDSITYQSTQILTADGSVIAFLNSSLFSKNFKNITKNHSYEMVSVPVGVAYGVNVESVRTMLVEAVNGLRTKAEDGRDIISPDKPVKVVLSNFGDNSVDLVLSYWVLVEEKVAMTSRVRETIYNTLNANNIEIPYPQRDVYIRSAVAPVPVGTK